MTDTTTLAPTDAEILDAAEDFRSQYTHGGTTFDEFDEIGFARAVLAKWGTPAPVGVEPVAWAATSEDGDVEALGMNQSRRFDTPLYTNPSPPEGMAGWMPIETAPKGKNNVILLRQACGSVANGFWLAEAYAGNGSWIWPYVHKNPTHWMPAPPIASEAKGAGHA